MSAEIDEQTAEVRPTPPRRPRGVSILAVFSALMAMLVFVAGVYLVLTCSAGYSAGSIAGGVGLVLLFVALYAACAVGLWQLRGWSAKAFLVVWLIIGIRGFPILTLPAAAIVWYLLRSSVREAFAAAGEMRRTNGVV